MIRFAHWYGALPDAIQWLALLASGVMAFGTLGWMVWQSWRDSGFFHEEIAAAAIRYPDIGVLALPAPARHHHVMWARLFIDGAATERGCEQGFLTTNGRFVSREEGLRIAGKRGQVTEKHGNPTKLYSEDMWPTPPEAARYTIDTLDGQ